MGSIQVFLAPFHQAQMRFHFMIVRPLDGYDMEKELTVKYNFHKDMQEVSIGYKNLWFDWWGSKDCFFPSNSIGYYFTRIDRWGKCTDHKTLHIPSLLDILRHRQFKKRMAVEVKKHQDVLDGLGALFG